MEEPQPQAVPEPMPAPIPEPVPVPQETPPTGSRKPKWLWVLIGVLILLGLLWVITSLFSKDRNTTSNNPPSEQTDNTSSGCSNQPNQAALNLFTAAAGVDGVNINWIVTDKYPKEFPVDFPEYTNAKVTVYTSISGIDKDKPGGYIFITQTCTTDSIAKVNEHFKSITLLSTGWQSQREALISQSSPDTSPVVLEQILQQLETQPIKIFVKGGVSDTNKDPRNVVMVTVAEDGSDTRISYMSYMSSY